MFSASGPSGEYPISDIFTIEMIVPSMFPSLLPTVHETAGRIPASYHKLEDGSLCLGSPLYQRVQLAKRSALLGFVESIVVPYFYGFALSEYGVPNPAGELAHGVRGLLDDYQRLLAGADDGACIRLIALLGLRKSVANKQGCPCGSGRRVGRCHNHMLNRLRPVASRRWFREHARRLADKARFEWKGR